MDTSEDLLLARIKEAVFASDPPFLEPLSDEEVDQDESLHFGWDEAEVVTFN
jgi:hypothetical protein